MKKCYAVWNKGYRRIIVVADSHVEALEVCSRSGFLRKIHNFRKYEEIAPPAGSEELIAGERIGVLEQDDNGVWVLKTY